MKIREINSQYNVVKAGSIPDRIAARMRMKMYERFLSFGPDPDDTILEVGATSDRTQLASNYLVSWYPHKQKITVCGIDDASFLEKEYPGLRFLRADGRKLPFASDSFDYVHSSAVFEHVGSAEDQVMFVAELWRVARKGIFLTTPNRWFPIEFHTVLPVLHWLPKPVFRKLIRLMGHRELALEKNLNLVGRHDLTRTCSLAGIRDCRIDSVSLLAWPSNLLLSARKASSTGARTR